MISSVNMISTKLWIWCGIKKEQGSNKNTGASCVGDVLFTFYFILLYVGFEHVFTHWL